MAREIQIPWACKRTGDCCRVQEVLVTPQERDVIEQAGRCLHPPVDTLSFVPAPKPHFLYWQTKGSCPMLAMDGDTASCRIYESRPTTCRTFLCGRVDGEAYDGQNLTDRLRESRRWQDYFGAHLRRQKVWALSHGYTRQDTR